LPVLAKVSDVFVGMLVCPKVFVETDGVEEWVVGEELCFCGFGSWDSRRCLLGDL
jgi:hypothetical protein